MSDHAPSHITRYDVMPPLRGPYVCPRPGCGAPYWHPRSRCHGRPGEEHQSTPVRPTGPR